MTAGRWARLFRRRPDRWAVPGTTYACNPRCGFLFTMWADRNWFRHTDIDPPGVWRKVGTWEQLQDDYGDCSGHLERTYGTQGGV